MYKEQIKKKKNQKTVTTLPHCKQDQMALYFFTWAFWKKEGWVRWEAGGMSSNHLKLLRWKNSSKKKVMSLETYLIYKRTWNR